MYISPRKKKQYVMVSLIFAVLIPISVGAFYVVRDWRSRASVTAVPEDVRITDITETSVILSWITPGTVVEGWVQYGTESGIGDGSPLTQDDRDVRSGTTAKRTTHYVTLSNLESGTKYYFILGSGGKSYKDPQGKEFEFTTGLMSESGSIPTPDPVYGSVTNGNNQESIVYISIKSGGDVSSPVSALTNDGGNFEIDLSHVRTASLDSRFDYSDSDELTIFAQGGDKGGAVLKTSVGASDPVIMTMAEGYPVTDVFVDTSIIDVGDGVNDDPAVTPDPVQPDDHVEDPEEPEDDVDDAPSKKHDVPLTALVLGSTTTVTGISDVTVTNVTENSFTVVWCSGSREVGYVSYGSTGSNLDLDVNDSRDGILQRDAHYTHHVSVKDLTPETTYYYTINSGEIEYDDDGQSYQITTPPTESSPPEYSSILGEVVGSGAVDAVIIGSIVSTGGESSLVSTVSDENGRWILSIGGIRNDDYDGYFQYNEDDNLQLRGLTKGDEDSSTHRIGDIESEVVSISLEMMEDVGSLETGEFDRGLYSVIESLTGLPDTAINRIAVTGITVALLMIIYGSYLLLQSYISEKNRRWEKDVLKELDLV